MKFSNPFLIISSLEQHVFTSSISLMITLAHDSLRMELTELSADQYKNQERKRKTIQNNKSQSLEFSPNPTPNWKDTLSITSMIESCTQLNAEE